MFNTYSVPKDSTPTAVFNGDMFSKIEGGNESTYTKYSERVAAALYRASAALLRGNVVNRSGQIGVEVTLTNLSATTPLNASLYAVIYERIGGHNIVRGVTSITDVTNLGAGESKDYYIKHDDLTYNNNYGVVIMLKSTYGSESGQIIQAYQAK